MSFQFNPVTGLMDTTIYPTKPTSETAARQQFMDLFNQVGDELNAQKADVTQRAYNVKYPPSPLVAAVGDGVADDTTEIQATIDAVSAAGGGIVFFSKGTYISSRISVPSNVQLVGAHKDVAILKLKSGVSEFAPFIINSDRTNGNTNIRFSDLTIDGNKAGQTNPAGESNACFDFIGVSNFIIERCNMINAQGDGIGLSYHSTNTALQNTDGVIRNCVFSGIYRNCISPLNVDNIVIEENVFNGTPYVASIDLETHNAAHVINDVKITRNKFKVTSTPLNLANTAAGTITNISIFDNEFATKGVIITNAQGFSIVKNRFKSGASITCNIDNATLTLDFQEIDNNKIVSSAAIAIYLYGRLEQLAVTRNIIKNSGNVGIRVSNANGGIIHGNTVMNSIGEGILLQDNNTNVLVSGNICYDTRSGGSRTQTYGVKIANNTNTYCMVTDNYCRNNVTSNFNIQFPAQHFVRQMEETAYKLERVYQTIKIQDGTWNGSRLTLGSYEIWVDASGRLRIKSGSPASDTDGAVIGTQT